MNSISGPRPRPQEMLAAASGSAGTSFSEVSGSFDKGLRPPPRQFGHLLQRHDPCEQTQLLTLEAVRMALAASERARRTGAERILEV